MKPLLLKTLTSLITNILWFYAMRYVSLTEVNLIGNTSPMIVVILSYFMLSEKIKPREIVTLIFSFTGIILLIVGRNSSNSEVK